MICPNCQKEIPDTVKFCPVCGGPTGITPETNSAVSQNEQPVQNAYTMPNAPQNEQPAQNAYTMPNAPQNEQPNQSAYSMPNATPGQGMGYQLPPQSMQITPKKKSFYKKWWFWLIIVLLVLIIVFTAIVIHFVKAGVKEAIEDNNYNFSNVVDYNDNSYDDDSGYDNDSEDSDAYEKDIISKLDVKQYEVNDDYSNMTYLVITNNSSDDVDISADFSGVDADGKIITAKSDYQDAVGKGSTIVLYCYHDEKPAKVDYSLSVEKSTYYKSLSSNLSFEKSELDGKVIVSVTNNGTETAKGVIATVLFFKGDKLVDCDYAYATDNDNELKPSKTVNKEIYTYDEYDSVQVFVSGYAYID